MNFPFVWPRCFFSLLCFSLDGRCARVLVVSTWALLACTGVWSQTVREQLGFLGLTHEQLAPQLAGVQNVRSPRRLSSGAVGSWRVPDARCEGAHFEQTLFFAHQKLVQMDLVLLPAGHDLAARDASPVRTAYATLVQSLRGQFGAELASSTSNPEMTVDTASWVSDGADVMLFLSGKPDHPALRLVIRQRQLVDAGEL